MYYTNNRENEEMINNNKTRVLVYKSINRIKKENNNKNKTKQISIWYEEIIREKDFCVSL